MDLKKQYIIQSISAASNNLRLNNQKIEVVALLRETILRSEDLENDIRKMKKITELSTLAIRLNEIYSYLTQGAIDFFKVSEKFKEHSQFLIKDLSHMLDMVSPSSFKQALEKINPAPFPEIVQEEVMPVQLITDTDNDIDVDLSKRKADEKLFEKSETDIVKEKLILDEERDEANNNFSDYENAIIKPIKNIEQLLKDISGNEIDSVYSEELRNMAEIMKENAKLSEKIGFEILTNMHQIVADSLSLLSSKEIMPGKEVVESIRACLIVIAAVVKGKEVDITNYLNRAEDFGKKLQTIL